MKPSFFHDVDLLELSPLHRLLFAGLWCWADRDGRLIDHPRQIKHDILPMDACDVDAMLTDLGNKHFILRYEVDSKRFIEILNFEKHQNPHPKEVTGSLPSPDEPRKETASREITRQDPEKPEPAVLSPFPSVTCHLSPHHADSGEKLPPLPASQETPEEEPLSFQDMLHRYVRRKGLKKPTKPVLVGAEEIWHNTAVGPSACDAALDGFTAAEWWKTAKEPFLGFVKNPLSWIRPRKTQDDDQEPAGFEKVVSGTAAPADAPQAAQIDYPARWNELVPAAKVEWDWKRSPVAALRLAELDDQFVARFDEMCGIAQSKHLSCGKEARWMTFEFAIRRSPKGWGWWRVLTEFRDMEPRAGNSEIGTAGPRPWVPGMLCDTAEQLKARRIWQAGRREQGKHTDDDRAAREGDIT